MSEIQIGRILAAVRRRVGAIDLSPRDPFAVLVSTVISLRTKDEVTYPAAERLLGAAPDPASLAALDEDEIAKLIYPAGFYRNKARDLKELSRRILDEDGAKVPDTMEGLTRFRGVGRKTANLVLGRGFCVPAICVDIHVHRICNRLGYVQTRTPDKTELALMERLPKKYWIEINELLVRYGQQVCTPVSPRCSECVVARHCQKVGVTRTR